MTPPQPGALQLAVRRVVGLLVVGGFAAAAVLLAAPSAAAGPAPRATGPLAPVLSVPPGPTGSSPAAAPSSAVSSQPPGIVLGPTLPTAPSTTAPPADATTGTGGGGGCGLFDVTCHVTSAINGWFKGLVTDALNPVLSLLGRSVLATPSVTGPGRVRDLWAGAAGIANTIVVLFVLVGGAVVMGHETLQTRYAAKDIAPRIVVGMIAANASLALVGIAVRLANSLSAALLGPGVDPSNATHALAQLVTGPLGSGGIFLILLGLVAAILAVVLLAVYVIRVALLVLLVVVGPLALICHALPQTEGVARLWWRALAGLLAIQVGQAVVLVTSLRVFFTPTGHSVLGLPSSGGLVDMLVAICLLYVLVRIPGWVSRVVFAGTGHSPTSVVKTVFAYKAIRAGIAALA